MATQAARTTPNQKEKPSDVEDGAGSSQVWPAVKWDPESNLAGAQDEGSPAHSPAAQRFAGVPVHQAPDEHQGCTVVTGTAAGVGTWEWEGRRGCCLTPCTCFPLPRGLYFCAFPAVLLVGVLILQSSDDCLGLVFNHEKQKLVMNNSF